MSFVISDNTLGQDINSTSNFPSSVFSLDNVLSSESLADQPIDLEKQQQHHLRQFLYYQGLALQRQQEQQRALAIGSDFSETDSFFINSRPSPDTFSSGAGSVEEQLHDFVSSENFSDSSVSAPSTPPDLLGTNIPSLAAIDFNPNDLICSPPTLTAVPMSRIPVSPLNDASNATHYSQDQEGGLHSKQPGRQLYDRQMHVSQDMMSGDSYRVYRNEGMLSQPPLYQSAANTQMYMARNRSSSIATPYLNTYAPPMPTVYISNVQPNVYQQSFMPPTVQSSAAYDGRMMIPMDAGNHQRTFSLPANTVSMQYGSPVVPVPAYHRTQTTAANDNSLAFADTAPEAENSASSDSIAGVQRKLTSSGRSKPYDRASSSSRSSLSGLTAGSLALSITTTEHSANGTSSKPPSIADNGASGSSTPGKTIVLEELKNLPPGMIRNPHGGGRGYIPGETPVDPKKKHQCGICGRGFARLYNLKSHASTHDPARPRPYDCPHASCTRSFSRLHDLERHRQGIHRDGPLMDAKVQGIAPAVARAQNRIAERAAKGDLV